MPPLSGSILPVCCHYIPGIPQHIRGGSDYT